MDKQKVVVAVLLFIIICSSSTSCISIIAVAAANEHPQPAGTSPLPPVVAKLKSQCANLINRLHSYFFPPNLDFRGTSTWNNVDDNSIGGDKVKEALTKSLGKSKAAVEDSAKSAAKLAGDTANKVKQTFSHIHHHPPPQPHEL